MTNVAERTVSLLGDPEYRVEGRDKVTGAARYAAGVREILECWFDGLPIREEYLIVDRGALAGAGAHSYSEGDATGGSDEAARFKDR